MPVAGSCGAANELGGAGASKAKERSAVAVGDIPLGEIALSGGEKNFICSHCFLLPDRFTGAGAHFQQLFLRLRIKFESFAHQLLLQTI